MRKDYIDKKVLIAVCLLILFGIVKEMQFLTVIALFVGLFLIFPKLKIEIPNFIREVVEEINIGKYSLKTRKLPEEGEIEEVPKAIIKPAEPKIVTLINEANSFLSSGNFPNAIEKYKEVAKTNDRIPHV